MCVNKFKVNKKQLIIVGVIFSTIVIILILVKYIAYSNSDIICAKIIGSYEVRGATYIEYVFEFNKTKTNGSASTIELKKIGIDSLKKMDCIKIEVSEYWSFINRIVDKRVLK